MKLIISIVIILAVVLPVILTSRNPEVVTTGTTTTSPPLTTTSPLTTTTVAPTLPPVQYARWARTNLQTPSANSDYRSSAIDSYGNIYVVGQLLGIATFDFGNGITINSTSNNYECLIVKYNSNGIAQWVKTSFSSGTSNILFQNVKIGPNGNIYVVGRLGNINYNFGNGVNLTGSAPYNGFLIVYNPSGNAQWAINTISSTESYFWDISFSVSGNIYIAGSITTTCDFGNNVSVGTVFYSFQPVLVKYNSSGIAQWAKTTIAGSKNSIFSVISVSSDESVYVSGYGFDSITTIINFGNNVNFTSANINGYLVKYDSTGIPQWVRFPMPNSFISRYHAVQVGLDGIYVVGFINAPALYNFGNNVTVQSTNFDESCILVKYNSNGDAQWAQSSGGGSFDGYFDLSIDMNENIYVVGYVDHQYSFDYGNGVIITAMNISYTNPLIVKYNSAGLAQWARTPLTNNTYSDSYFYGVSNGSDGSVCAVGYIKGAFVYDFGDNVTVTSPNNNRNFVIVKYA